MLYLLIGLAEGVALVTVFTWVWALFEKRFGVFLAGVGSMAVNAVVVLAGGLAVRNARDTRPQAVVR